MRVGAYSLCYQEGKLLAANIKLMYNLVDQFVVVIGQVEISDSHRVAVDTKSKSILELIEDPLMKITIVDKGNFVSKDEMTCLALEIINTEVIIQLDCDEFWSPETFLFALEKIREGFTRIQIPHIIYFRSVKTIFNKKDQGIFYFSPARMWKVIAEASLGHFTGKWTRDGIELIDLNYTLDNTYAIHHLGWVQFEQIRRKIRFYRQARKYQMPSHGVLFFAWPLIKLLGLSFTMGPNRVQIVNNNLARPSDEINGIIKSFRKNSEM